MNRGPGTHYTPPPVLPEGYEPPSAAVDVPHPKPTRVTGAPGPPQPCRPTLDLLNRPTLGYAVIRNEEPAYHTCHLPGWWERRRNRLKLGALIECTCGRSYRLEPEGWRQVQR